MTEAWPWTWRLALDPSAFLAIPGVLNAHYNAVFFVIGGYLLLVRFLHGFMESRHPLKIPAVVLSWNVAVCAFSVVGSYFTWIHMYFSFQRGGMERELCTLESEHAHPWVCCFCLSKIPELFDTILIILKKKPLTFLHVYHHVVTLLFCWDSCAREIPNGSWFAGVNLAVHSLMYAYYSATSLKIRIPGLLKRGLTTLQIVQMFAGLAILLYTDRLCPMEDRTNFYFGLAMYSSFVVLFIQFFVKTYLRKGAKGD